MTTQDHAAVHLADTMTALANDPAVAAVTMESKWSDIITTILADAQSAAPVVEALLQFLAKIKG